MSAQVRSGYKLTEVGVIPEDWQAVQLRQKIEISHGFPFASQYFVEHGQYMLTTPGNFYEDGGFRYLGAKQKYYAGPIPANYLLNAGDLIVAMTEQADGLLGSAAIIHDSGKYLHNQRLGRIRISCADIDAGYLFYVFNSIYYRCKVRETAAGTKVKHTSPEKLREIQIPIPFINEQRAIAAALFDMDALINGLDQLIAKKRDIKQAAMQQLLTGQQRLPGFSGEWEVKRLGELSSFLKGKGLPKSELSLSGVDPCIHYGELFTQYPETIGDVISRTNGSRDAFRSIANDVLMPTSDVTPRGLAKASCITIDGVILGGDILVIRSDVKKIDGSFLSYVIRHNEDQILQLVTGSTVFHLYGSGMKKFTFSMPPAPEQTAIATILSDMDSELATLETRRDKAHQLKQGMMQELLTGRVRLI